MKFREYMIEGVWSSIKLGAKNALARMNVAFMEGMLESWKNDVRMDPSSYSRIKSSLDKMNSILMKADYNETDEAAVKSMISSLNRFIESKRGEK